MDLISSYNSSITSSRDFPSEIPIMACSTLSSIRIRISGRSFPRAMKSFYNIKICLKKKKNHLLGGDSCLESILEPIRLLIVPEGEKLRKLFPSSFSSVSVTLASQSTVPRTVGHPFDLTKFLNII